MTNDTLPRRLRVLYTAVSEAPWTNINSMNGEILTYATGAFIATAAVLQVTIDEGILYAWLIFLSGKIGFAMGGAWAKRATYQPSPPTPPDAEDAAAVHGTPEVKPAPAVLTREDAQRAADVYAGTEITRPDD